MLRHRRGLRRRNALQRSCVPTRPPPHPRVGGCRAAGADHVHGAHVRPARGRVEHLRAVGGVPRQAGRVRQRLGRQLPQLEVRRRDRDDPQQRRSHCVLRDHYRVPRRRPVRLRGDRGGLHAPRRGALPAPGRPAGVQEAGGVRPPVRLRHGDGGGGQLSRAGRLQPLQRHVLGRRHAVLVREPVRAPASGAPHVPQVSQRALLQPRHSREPRGSGVGRVGLVRDGAGGGSLQRRREEQHVCGAERQPHARSAYACTCTGASAHSSSGAHSSSFSLPVTTSAASSSFAVAATTTATSPVAIASSSSVASSSFTLSAATTITSSPFALPAAAVTAPAAVTSTARHHRRGVCAQHRHQRGAGRVRQHPHVRAHHRVRLGRRRHGPGDADPRQRGPWGACATHGERPQRLVSAFRAKRRPAEDQRVRPVGVWIQRDVGAEVRGAR
mmetsp:Transcript_19676/g.49328  ORF Transcript_19676/g.49328 Transcript_19676/m.49328 type:complete len:442 (+) Transcript_19676:124-1449(+)